MGTGRAISTANFPCRKDAKMAGFFHIVFWLAIVGPFVLTFRW